MTPSILPTTTALLVAASSPLSTLSFTQHSYHPLHKGVASTRSLSSSSSALFAAKKKSSKKSAAVGAAPAAYAPSTVIDLDGPTPDQSPDPFPEVDIDALPEAHYDPNNHPVPHQPWRRGDTDGCHDPISAPWRIEAEDVISDAVTLVGGKVADVTWYMSKCVVSLDEKSFKHVVNYVDGPEVRVMYPDPTDISGHDYVDPEAGTDDEMFTEEDELLDYEQYDDDTEYEILKANMPTEYDEESGEELPPREPRSREERVIEMQEEWESRWLDEPHTEKPSDGMFSHPVDTKALSVVSQAITKALEEEVVETKLKILSRHDIILTSPLENPCILDSQKEFDAAVDLDVYVETRDPWGSNRVLAGKLVARNAMDVIINQDNSGRMVTVPNSMVHQVLLPSGLAMGSAKMKAGMDDDEEADVNGDVEDGGYLDVEEEEVFE